MRVPYVIPVWIEQTEDGFMAYNDELQVCAGGTTETEAVDNFRAALDVHVNTFGQYVLEPFARRKLATLEV